MTNWRRGAGCQSRKRPTGHSLNEICVVGKPLSQSGFFSRSIVSMRACPSGPVYSRNVPMPEPPWRLAAGADASTGGADDAVAGRATWATTHAVRPKAHGVPRRCASRLAPAVEAQALNARIPQEDGLMSGSPRTWYRRVLYGTLVLALLAGCGKKDDAITQAEKKDVAKGVAAPSIAETKAIAEEGFIYGLPIVMNYAVMYEYAVDTNSGQFKAPFNEINNEHRVFTYEDTAIVTPNSDTPYSFVWMDLRAEPMVLSVPAVEKERYYSVQLDDGNTYNYGYIGSRATGNEAGDYMVVGPDWKGETPPGIKKVFRSTTQFSLAVYRTQLFNPADMPNVVKVQAGYKVAAAVRVPQAARAAGGAGDRFPEDRQGAGQDELLRVSRLRPAVRPAGAGGEGDPRQARQHRHRARQDLRLQGPLARAQGRSRCWA